MVEFQCYQALQQVDAQPLPGESALDAVCRLLVATDPLLRPYRYPQVDGMRRAFQVLVSAGKLPVTAEALNTFQAGYTAAAKELSCKQ